MPTYFHSNPFTERIETGDNTPTEAVLKLAILTGIEATDWNDLISATQQIWCRPQGSERSELAPIFTDKLEECMELFNLLGLCNDVYPRSRNFKYGLVLGSTAKQMAERLDFLEKLIASEAMIVEKLVLLAGARELWTEDYEYLEQVITNTQDCKTEADALSALLKNTSSFPRLKELPIALIDSQAEAGDSRPRTINTVRDWIATQPLPGACIALSTNPYIPYQDLTLRTALDSRFTLETCGPVDQEDRASAALCFDSLARWIWQHDKWKKELQSGPLEHQNSNDCCT